MTRPSDPGILSLHGFTHIIREKKQTVADYGTQRIENDIIYVTASRCGQKLHNFNYDAEAAGRRGCL